MRRALLALAVLLSLAPPAFAQFETATVVGVVKDSTGAVVPDAKVTLANTQTGVTAERTTGTNGSYEFFNVRIGTYVIAAEKAGFSVALVDNINVTVGARQRDILTQANGLRCLGIGGERNGNRPEQTTCRFVAIANTSPIGMRHEAIQRSKTANTHHDQVAGLAGRHFDLGQRLGASLFCFTSGAFKQQRLQFATTVGFH